MKLGFQYKILLKVSCSKCAKSSYAGAGCVLTHVNTSFSRVFKLETR
jgi:hypothetical protein